MIRLARCVVGTIAAVAVLLAETSTGVSAYTLEGPVWSGQPGPGTCCANLSGYVLASSAGQNQADHDGWYNGMSAWTNSPALITWYGVDVSSSGWSIFLTDTNQPGTGWDGLTAWSFSGCCFTSVTGYLNWAYTQSYSPGAIQSVAGHELGHAAGLGHSDQCVLMYPSTYRYFTCGVFSPQQDDINGIDALY